jgi:MFS family permease
MTLRTTLFVYFVATFLQAGTYGLTFLLPPLFEAFGADEKDVGTVLIFTTVSTLVTVLYMGHITAFLGRLNAVGLASVLIAISLFMFGQATEFGPMLFLSGAILGVGWGLFYILTPLILTEITQKADRIRVFTMLSVFIMAGFGLSPVFGYLLVDAGFDIGLTFTLTAAFCLISGAMFMALKGTVLRLSHGQVPSISSGLSLRAIRAVFQSRAIRPIIMVGLGASVFAAVTNFQTVYAAQNGLEYATYFFSYTVTVIVCRIVFAEFLGGRAPYGTISILLAIMVASVTSLLLLTDGRITYIIGAVLFGIGYGVSYPIVKAMAANDAEPEYLEQTLQIFGFSYFIGVFGFPFVAGWTITAFGIGTLLIMASVLAAVECMLALHRYVTDLKASPPTKAKS